MTFEEEVDKIQEIAAFLMEYEVAGDIINE